MDFASMEAALRSWGGAERLLQETFADSIELFGHIEFAAWLLDETAGTFDDSCPGAYEHNAAADFFIEAARICGQRGGVKAAVHPGIKRYLLEAAVACFSDAFERLCARYGATPGTTPAAQASTLGKLRNERKTDRVGGVLLFYRLWPLLEGTTAADKYRAFEALGGKA